jgi:UDP-N-acetylglucosamine diphosphorylase / glucose-1-phosphate thymidylyltransferase / UDP-N-acetylgalactosamine diphosphorylase / glucosamine-1-phosphate N-acetyltransferase / galactosamine-1-phosphate N-acetyltransferase
VSELLSIEYFFGQGDPALPFDIHKDFANLADLLGPRRTELLEKTLGGKQNIVGAVDTDTIDDANSAIGDIRGSVYIGEGTTIQPGVLIKGPVYIGKNCDIKHGAIIREGTILGDNCVVGHSAEIKNSLCMSGSKLQSGIFAGDSIVGRSARLGSGVITANRRFDQGVIALGSGAEKIRTELRHLGAVIGDHVRIGANAVTAPGTAVGPYTWVTSLVSLYGFVPRAKRVTLSQELIVTDQEPTQLS